MRNAIALALLSLFAFQALAGVNVPSLTIGRQSPVRSAQFEPFTQAVGTAAVHAFDDDLAAAELAYDFLQEVRISNRHATNGLCWAPAPLVTTCDDACGASTITCDETATDGDFIAAGTSIVMPITGMDCACIVASAASTVTTATRVKRSIAY